MRGVDAGRPCTEVIDGRVCEIASPDSGRFVNYEVRVHTGLPDSERYVDFGCVGVDAAVITASEGTIFYENLLDKFQETYGFSLSQFLEPDVCGSLGAGSSTSSAGGVAGGRVIPDSVRLVLISVQKIYICLGDLARYREQAMGTTNYGKARSWYLKAQQIAPKNGRPYNQLAILALYARRKLDAVYYYMRSLAASNPFLTARESLLALFDDARKKYDHLERKRLEEEGVNQQPSLESPLEEERLEIWIRPDGTTSHRSSRQGDQASREGRAAVAAFDN
ncbi:hypothetical protein HPB51_021331 [Rhipicephalus microplus]|uniref:Uncharacterized protein n=1 Tax=Rhipicephalus microplus TaxID=6941 RepID=A0A9J6F7X6_RHIMP|nr:hypothetical protein HPB51_021331 [Rhipicephalus microplus]